MPQDTTPLPLLALLAAIAIAIVVIVYAWGYFDLTRRFDDYFATRRRNRRMRNYVKADAKLTQQTMAGGLTLVSLDTGKVTRYAPARHRR